jgi:anti-sigma regulatory factor (Ser/Thr protein kinase)
MTLRLSPPPYAELRLGILAEDPSLHVLRRTTEAALHAWGLPALVDDTLIIVNELGTNAAKAAPGDWMELSLRLLPEGIMIELWDSSPDLPPETGPDELNLLDLDAEGGRGLPVVSAYAAKHGVTQTTGRQGKTVWALCAHSN